MGVTISCSIVPTSFSRMIAMEVKSSEMIMIRTATIPGTKKSRLSRFGLYQVRTRASMRPYSIRWGRSSRMNAWLSLSRTCRV